MIKSRKISIFVLILMLALSSILFVACGKTDYSKTYLSASQTYIELFKDEEKTITITIENPVNDMSSTLKYTFSNPAICELNVASKHDMSTTYTITAKNGGNTTIDFISLEGGRTISINVYVKEYSSILQAGENGLYLSSTTELIPSSSDFTFDDSSTERDLSYYFYGENNVEGSLTLDDVKNNDSFINNFVKVKLYTKENKSYLIFTDKEGKLFTLGRSLIIAGSENIKYSFIDVTAIADEYLFEIANASTVKPGDTFTFLTQYNSEITEKPIFCERTFTVVIDINKEDVSHEFGYKIVDVTYQPGVDNTSYKIDELKNGKITLIPNYTSVIKSPLLAGYSANYLTAYVEVAVKNLNEFLKVKTTVADKSIASTKVYNSYKVGEYTIFAIELNCGIGSEQNTSLDINLYYQGFENSEDEKVNYKYSIPVEIHIKPTKLLVNNIDLSSSTKTYKFYNTYASESFGWQPYNFTIVPQGAKYDRLYLDLTDSDLQVRYMNVIYTTGILEITNLNETIYIKGADNAALTVDNKKLPINLDFSVIQSDTISSYLEYSIMKGPSPLAYKTDAFKEKIYVERFGGDVLFDDIYTDAEFASMAFTHISGIDVVNFKYDTRNPFIQDGLEYRLNLYISPKAIGNGTYSVALDNGVQIAVNIEVRESLNSVAISTKDENDVIKFIDSTFEEDNASSLIYLYNAGGKTNFDLTLIANNSKASTAIEEILPDIQSPNISMTQLANDNAFVVYIEQTGTMNIVFSIQGFSIENFERTSKTIIMVVKIVSYDYVGRLNVYKLKDGFGTYASGTSASYANVYSNTYNEDARKIKLEIGLQNPNAYLFANPSTDSYVDSLYQHNFLYFESDARIYRDENPDDPVNLMYFSPAQSNIYILKGNLGDLGTFDTETLTFTAFSNIQVNTNLKIVAHVKQYGKTYSYTINISIKIYEMVEGVTLQTAVSEIEFSALERENSIIAYPINKTATNGEIVALFVGGEISVEGDGQTYKILDENSISYLVSDGKTFIKLKVSDTFVTKAENYTEEMMGDLIIVAKDWLDNGGNIRSEFQGLAYTIKVRFANGTVKNRFTIEDANDLIKIKDNLSAHYQISTTIDASSISNELPLGELKGSIVGVNEYAIITNITISKSSEIKDGNNVYSYYGMFSKLAEDAYIEYVQFVGKFDIDYKESQDYNSNANYVSYIGLIAGENNGKLINVGANIGLSEVYMQNGNFGGLVGTNNGEILQDFTLFEDNDSNTRSIPYESKIVSDLKSAGRYSYEGKTPFIGVQMTDFTNVYYHVGNDISKFNRIGGMVGFNQGIIKKIDSKKVSFNGYSNYMTYALITSQPSNISQLSSIDRTYIGGLVGESIITNQKGVIISGTNVFDDKTSLPLFTIYADYKLANDASFEAGEGIVVGGEVWGYGDVGGVVGNFKYLSQAKEFAGITTRTFVRGQKISNRQAANLALIANVEKNVSGGLSTAFAIQAVDDGKMGEESSMAVLYNGDKDTLLGYINDVNKLGFGNFNNGIGSLKGYSDQTLNANDIVNVFTYVISRELELIKKFEVDGVEKEQVTVMNSSKESYYGDFVIVGTDEGNKVVLAQKTFTKGTDSNLSIDANFENKMLTETTNAKDVFFAYYFQVVSIADESEDISSAQTLLDNYLNRINPNSSLYPFVANGEMIFNSKTPDVLTIDQVGKITIKKTGLALISATSVLNTNNALNFYIYVVNYFNPETLLTNNERNSIIYNDSSASSVAVDESNIELRGNNSAELFVRARYDLEVQIDDNSKFISDKFGRVVNFKGISFNLSQNDVVSALISDISELDISVLGQNIIIRKNESTKENSYSITITPILQLTLEDGGKEITYTVLINKSIDKTKVNYELGAVSINNKNYNTVPIPTSKSVSDEIYINSTDKDEENPLYYIVGLNGQTIQSSNQAEEIVKDYLFNVEFDKISSENVGNGIFKNTFNLLVSVNTSSSIYTNRYNKEIYGEYLLYIQAQSNTDLNVCIKLNFERTEVSIVTIDNYKSLNEMGGSLTTTSEYAYPGESGLLQITISPEDSDFDYILIENDTQNYQPGNATSTFSLLSRKAMAEGNGIFENGTIYGSSTSKGIKLTQDEIIKAYNQKDEENNYLYYQYNGVVYVRYDMSSKNVTDLSTSRINVTFFKDGDDIYSTHKDLKVKLQNFVGITLDGKQGLENQNGYYMSYTAARGLKYKINIESFGFKQENIKLRSSNDDIAQISLEGGNYYLTLTDGIINHGNAGDEVDLIIEAKTDGENSRQAESKTKIKILEYVLNYNNLLNKNADIVVGAGYGVINVQVGSNFDLALDLFDFVEYDHTISSVVASIEKFFLDLATEGEWYSVTNLISDDQPDYNKAPQSKEEANKNERKVYAIGKNSFKNYYFSAEGLKIQPLRTHLPDEGFYYFGFEGKFKEQNGVYVVDENASDLITTKVTLNVYSTSSEESPIPVYDYDDLCNMQKGGYYILLNDITLPNTANETTGVPAFTPLDGDFASFDGNGHAINFAGTYDMGNQTDIGLFKNLEENSQIKNLIVNYSSALDGSDLNTNPNDTTYALYGYKTVKFVTTADAFVFGSIVADNAGIITNCQVFTEKTNTDEYYLAVKADNALTGSSYIGGIAGRNSGFITNCGVSINVKAPYNIGGVVAQNYKKIAGCYFKEGKLINNSQFSQYVGGFAVSNSIDGEIITSFVSGKQTSNSLYTQDKESYITSTIIGGGFIVENAGKISDCYTDIYLARTTSEMAGFVYQNSGTVKNSFSLSELRNNTTASAGFVKQDVISSVQGKFVNCYYYHSSEKKINNALFATTFEGVKPLDEEGFANFEKNFSDYSYDNGMSLNSVWFTTNGSTSSNFVEYIPTTQKITIKTEEGSEEDNNNKNTQSNTLYKTEVMDFGINRLELVSPNVRVLSIRNFAYSETDEATGNVTYFYNDDTLTPNRGSIHNPRLIYDAQTMENEILNETATTFLNTTNYRLISDVSYSNFEGHSSLYKVKFAGIFEGNGMKISGISLVSMDDLDSAGLFAQIGNSASKTGSVKNLTISPRTVSFNNATSVGILAGTIKYGYVFDITTEAVQGNSSTVTGLKFVGGVFGKAISSFTIKDVYSQANVSANYSPDRDLPYNENSDSNGAYSYAGSIGGFVGKGKLYNAHVNDVNSVMGGRAGFAYGGLGSGADVRYTFVNVKNASTIKAYQYGGYIAGEVGGNLIYSHVYGNENDEYTFSNLPKVAIAVGGIAGRFNGGLIKEALMEQSFSCNQTESNQTISYVGGIVGQVEAVGSTISKIQECVVNANIKACATLGGGVGRILTATVIDELAIKSENLSIKGQRANPCLGGIVGSLTSYSGASLEMSNSYCNANINIETYTAGVQSTAYAGGLIGSSNILPRLYYCYTSSKIDAIVYDSRQVGELTDFANVVDKERISYEQLLFGNKNSNNGNSSYQQPYDQVYYWGSNVSGAESYDSKYISFKTKAKTADIKLAVSNFGLGSADWSGTNITQSSLYNMLGKDYQIEYNSSILNLSKTASGYEEIKTDGVNYFEFDAETKNYYMTLKSSDAKAEIDSLDDLIQHDEEAKSLIYYYVEKGDYKGKYKYAKTTVTQDNTTTVTHTLYQVGTNNKYEYKEITTATETSSQSSTEITFGGIKLSDLKLRVEFNEADLHHKSVYEGEDGNYYLAYLKVNESGEVVETYQNIKTKTEVTNVKLIQMPIWQGNTSGFSTLTMETQFSWLNKL